MSETALALIQQAKESKAEYLDIGDCGLSEWPEALFELTWLKGLCVSNSSAFVSFDDDNEWLRNATDEQDNTFNSLPDQLKKLEKLEVFICSGSYEHSWQINDIQVLSYLHELKKLSISHNNITDILPLEPLVNLSYLSISNNNITDILPLEPLVNLSYLSISNNNITDILPLEPLVNLSYLSISNNNITDISPLRKLEKLSHLNLYGNDTPNLPENILNGTAQEIIRYLNEVHTEGIDGEEKLFPLNDLKILLLGNTNVGKTNFLELWQHYNEHQNFKYEYQNTDTTKGLVYNEIKAKQNMRYHIWDFGGQDYYHGTHRMFFSPDALHVLLWSKDSTTRIEGERVFELDYWLRCAEQMAQSKDGIELLLVENKIDKNKLHGIERIMHLPDAELIEKFKMASVDSQEDEEGLFALNFCAVSLEKKWRMHGLFELLEERISLLNSKFSYPKKYIDIRNKFRRTKKEVWTFSDYKSRTKEKDNVLLKTLHRAGCILYFDKALPKKIFTAPQALLDLLYKEVLNDALFDNNGVLTIENDKIKEIADAADSNDLKLKYDELLTLLLAFKLIFTTKDGTYYAPQYLSEKPSPWLELFEQYNFSHANICIQTDHYLMNLMLLEIFQEYGSYLGKKDKEHMFWRDGLVIEKNEEVLLIKYNRAAMQMEFYGGASKNNLKLQEELIEFIIEKVDPTDRDEIVEQSIRLGEIQVKDAEGKLIHPKSESREKRMGWASEKITIDISLDGKYYVAYKALIEAQKLGVHTVLCTRKHIVKPNKTLQEEGIKKPKTQLKSLYDYNDYLPNRIKGKMKKLFISYSKKDLKLVNTFLDHLSVLKLEGKIATWYCTELTAGSDWNEEIQEHFDQADMVCFMISSNFVRTNYIWEYEVKKALDKREKNKSFKIIPIVLNFCDWKRERYDLTKYTALPYTLQPVCDFKNQDMAWYIIEQCLKIMIEKDLDPTGDAYYRNQNTIQNNPNLRKLFERLVDGQLDNNSL